MPNGPLSAAQQAQAAAIAAAVASGIVVCFSAGNGHWGFPGQHPDVISVGGVYRDQNGNLQASNYASGFVSNIYPGRQSPDVCGMVGQLPGAEHIMLPVQDGDQIDVSKSATDGTTNNDGWALFSGTSAACPQVAGVVALMKEACKKLTPAQIRDILKSTAVDITAGSSNPNTPGTTGPGPDTATGAGLVDAAKAAAVAKLRCMVFPLFPLQPLVPLQPLQPLQPVRPLVPLFPLQPVQPLVPLLPLLPVKPLVPLIPIRPFLPLLPPPIERNPTIRSEAYGDAEMERMRQYGESQAQLTADEAEYLEQLVMEEGEDLLGEL